MTQKILKKEASENKKSKLQQKYERLLKDIEKRKKQHKNLTEGLRAAVPRVISELQPLAKSESEWHIKKLLRLDEIVDEIVISKTKKEIFVSYVLEEIFLFLTTSHPDNEELKNLYKKYAKEEFTFNNIPKQFDFDENKQSTSEEIIDEFEDHGSFESNEKNSDPKINKKEKQPNKKQEKELEEEKILAQDAKAIYFRLIKKYHPDRQQDLEKQKEYTEISKLVTKAYKENDFMALLRLQVEYIDENENDAHALADDMIERYNKILLSQLTELNLTVLQAKRNAYGLFEDFFDESYTFSEKLFEKKKREIEISISKIKQNIEDSHLQKKGWFKQWLRELQELNDKKNLAIFYTGF
ncbi:hypothetical protein EGI26_15700 [Lacihabitans sp. CCS-44]|uniref:hypothetical protein n=1 Tax=Lacihabitans sp. CCS-44 TaxID=2487331 RepID=UPI0020CF93DC|nr:hypothetical protein [Lacihabitans sp. CCS-44]MCP9756609.1 hypothetical protein [Lacihabitans sp. CCS-44]